MSANTNSNYISPTSVSYYYGRLLREEANKILENHKLKNGMFLLRELVAECGSYALSICFDRNVHHYKIDRQNDGTVKIDKGRNFLGPVELIKHHQNELDGLITKPLIACDRPKGTQPIYYLFINDAEFYKLVNDEINERLSKSKSSSSLQQYNQELAEAKGRFRYRYEKIVLKNLHYSQPWYKKDLDRDSANELLRKSGLTNGKFIVRGGTNDGSEEYRISLCFNNEIKHYKIKLLKNGSAENTKYCLEGGMEFDSITQLVDYYHRNADGLAYILKFPLIQVPSKFDPIWFNSLNQRAGSIIANPSMGNQRLSAILNNEGLYDSNKMYETILNTNDSNNNNQNSGQAVPYLDDEPNNAINDVTDLKNIPETKRSLFENEENYEYNSLTSYTIDLKDVVTYDKLGSGCFGSVYRGTYKLRNGRSFQEIPVAIKQLNIDTEDSKREISKEAELMKSLNNPHVIKFIGMCFQSNGSLMIVLELAKLGPLHKYLRTHKEDMSIVKIIKICYQVAIAMEYLSSKNLVHRDLAARNVLLVSEDLAKVSDFGMSRKMDENKYYETHSQGKWPLKWYPPDATHQGKFDEKSDVWSFGVTCWEATSYGGRPYQGIDITLLLLKLENGHRLDKPSQCPDEVYNLMYKCWAANKRNRPTFSELVRDFRMVIYELYQIKMD